MNKKFLAVSIAALFASAAHAQTSVTLYGIADGDFRIDHTAIGTLKSVGSGGESGNRWGIRGSEDLGGGLKAIFTFEQGFQLDDSSVAQGNVGGVTPTSPVNSTGSRLFSRTSQVGLSSAQGGDILFGRAFTPFYVLWTSIDPMAGGLLGGAQNYAVGNVTRFDNGIYYNSPKFFGLQLTTVFRLGESTTNTVASGAVKDGGNAGNASLTYSAGPVTAGYSFMSIKSALDNNTTRTQFGGAAYDLGFLKLHGLYFNTRNATTTRLQSYALGITVPVKSFSFFGQFARIDNRYKQNNSSLQYNDANFIGTGANYAFSKRTDVYVSYAKQVNKGAAVNVITDSSIAGLYTTTSTATVAANVTPGFNPYSAQIGIRHRF